MSWYQSCLWTHSAVYLTCTDQQQVNVGYTETTKTLQYLFFDCVISLFFYLCFFLMIGVSCEVDDNCTLYIKDSLWD